MGYKYEKNCMHLKSDISLLTYKYTNNSETHWYLLLFSGKQIVNFCEEFKTTAKLNKNPNSVTIFSGLMTSAQSVIDLSDFAISAQDLANNMKIAKSSQYDIECLLNKDFSWDNLQKESHKEAKKNILLKDINPIWILVKLPDDQIIIFCEFLLSEFKQEIENLFIF